MLAHSLCRDRGSLWRRWIRAAGMAAVALLAGPTLTVTIATAAEPGADAIPDTANATHRQVKVIKPTEGTAELALATFCLTGDGRIVAVLDRQEPTAGEGGGFLPPRWRVGPWPRKEALARLCSQAELP